MIHFRSSDHPGLPTTLRMRPLVALMITGVDEKAKKQLLYASFVADALWFFSVLTLQL